LQVLARTKGAADQVPLLYQVGLVFRAQGMQELKEAEANPQASAVCRARAERSFAEAVPYFAIVAAHFSSRASDAPKDLENLPAEADAAAKARCEMAEMQLRLEKAKEAQASAAPFLKDPALARSQYRDRGRFYHGLASFLLKDYAQAEQSLSMLAPFTQPDFGVHAHYLLARTHHVAEERAEAGFHYQQALEDYQKNRGQGPAPGYVARAAFYLGQLHCEAGKFTDAKSRLQEFVKLDPKSPLRPEAELRIGYCQVQLKEFPQAARTLTPLANAEPIADQVLFWLGKAQAAVIADPKQPAYVQAMAASLKTLRLAQERAERLQDQGPDGKTRRAAILLEIADTLQVLKQAEEAAGIYRQLLADKLLTDRDEELGLRLASALHCAGDFDASDEQCGRFLGHHPQSTLAPAVAFVQAENSYFRALAAEEGMRDERREKRGEKDVAGTAPRAGRPSPLIEEAAKRLTTFVARHPDFPKVNVARFSLGLIYYNNGDLQAARKALESIPASERSGEVALASYVLADCILRALPATVPEDALAAGKMEEQLKSVADLLEGFLSDNPRGPELADALFKHGVCQQRLAELMVQPQEKAKLLSAARRAFDRVAKEFPKSPLVSQAYLERANAYVASGNLPSAVNELRRFTKEPFNMTPKAPMAMVQLATCLRAQKKAAEAADVLAKARPFYEPKLADDPEQVNWISLLRYHHGLALRDAGKFADARQIFDTIMKTEPRLAQASAAALALGQCLRDEGQLRLAAAAKAPAPKGKTNPKQSAAAAKLVEEGCQLIRDGVGFLEKEVERLAKAEGLEDVRARMLYEAAWGSRALADFELANARAALQDTVPNVVQKPGAPAGKPASKPAATPAEVPIDRLPLQPSETKARALYRHLIDTFPEQPLANDARFELAELLAQRHDYGSAAKLLAGALEREPAEELAEKIHLQLGTIVAAQGNPKAALERFDFVLKNPKSPVLVGWALYRTGEALLQNRQYAEAVKRLVFFRDVKSLQKQPGLSDAALLRLGQAYALARDGNASRQALERLRRDYPNSPLTEQARQLTGGLLQQQVGGLGLAWQFPPLGFLARSPLALGPTPMQILGQARRDVAVPADLAREISNAAILVKIAPRRTSPVEFVPVNLPDPFEHSRAVRLRSLPNEKLE
jgi:TolA-binding protein